MLAFAFLGWCFIGSAQAAIVNEPMTGATAPGWVIGGSAYLSASTGVDPAGNGWLRLTEPLNDQAGFAFFDSPFDISQGVVISFDYATWGGNGADGYSIFLFDGSYDASTFVVGASGGSLGYDKKTVAPVHAGLTGGYIGVGVDEYGNYSSPTEGRIGGPGFQVNEVGVRGPFDHPSGAYYWLGGSGTLGTQLAFNNQLFRPGQTGAQYRKVVIYLTPLAPPSYLRVDTYVQFGYNQPLTAVVTGLTTSRPIPASVKVGYAASTGGQNNYHEIRNLVIDPLQTDIDLAMAKVVSSLTVTQGGGITYTVTARNYGPASTTATNVPIVDTLPALLTGATWTCTGSGGATCGAVSGSGSINTTATLPFNSAATYAVRSTVVGTAPLGSVITNTATLTPPAGITDYDASNNSASATATVTGPTVTISGMVYNDANHNGVRDGGEVSSNIANIFAKLFRSSDLTTTLAVVAVNQAAGTYTFNNVPSYGNYTIILSNNNTANTFNPSFPNAQWVYTNPVSYTLANVAVGGIFLADQDFGVYQGTRLSGRVFKDDGINGTPANANDGIQNAAETGLAGFTMSVCNNAACVAIDTTTTDAAGNYALYINWGNAFQAGTARITQTLPPGYFMVNYSPGTATGTAVNIPGGFVTLTFNRGTSRSGILFGDAPANTFLPTLLAQNALQGNTVYYGHTFTPGSGGLVSFSTSARTTAPPAPAWPAVVYYRDVNCNGTFDGGDGAMPASLSASAGTPVCLLVQDTVPGTATLGTTDAISTRATFTYINSIGPVVSAATVTDTTTVAASGSVSVSGTVYSDANHNGIREAGENSSGVAGIYAKLFRSSDLTTMLSITSVVQSSGTYTFTVVPPNDTYTIILSSTSTATFDPSFPNAQWVATGPANYTLSGVAVGGAALANQNFGVFNGTRIDGQVLKDDGAATGANANNGAQNAGETGIAGQMVSVCDNASCVAIDTEPTDANGLFSLYVPWSTVLTTARLTQTTMPVGYSMVNYNPGTAAGSGVNLGSRYITFAFTSGTDVSGLVFSDVPDNTFLPTPLAKTGSQTAQLDYAHTFIPGSGGLVSFATSTRTQPAWPVLAYYQDVNCNGIYDGGDVALPAPVSTVAGTPVCVIMRDTILATAPTGTTDLVVTRATFTFTNSSGPVVRPYDVSDTTTVQTPNLGGSTKAWTDVNGGSVNAGDMLEYIITIVNSTATATAYNVAVTDNIPANTNGFAVTSIPALATNLSTTAGGTNGTGYLNVTGITVPPASSVTVEFIVFIDAAAVPGTTINNTATITQLNGTTTLPVATAATVVAVSGDKQLYMYDSASTPARMLSRTPPAAGTFVTVVNGTPQVWTMSPAAQAPITIDPAVNPNVRLNLYMRRDGGFANGNRSVTASLQCSSGGTVLTQTQNLNMNATITLYNFNLPVVTPVTCGTVSGSTWNMTISDNTAADQIRVYTYNGGNISRALLPVSTVISVASITAYDAAYSGGSALATALSGTTVYIRSVVSDPFGSFDITSASIIITDPSGTVRVIGDAMTQVADSGAATKTYEYVYAIPVLGPAGNWTFRVTAQEGTEGTINNTRVATLPVILAVPNILVLKSVQAYSDPVNTAPPYRPIPGAVMEYTVIVTNSGLGPADNNSTVLTDAVPANMTLYVDTGSGDPVTFSGCSVAPACGLAFNYGANVKYTNTFPLPALLAPPNVCGNFTYVPSGSYDANVRGLCINPSGILNGSGGQFTIKYRMRLN